MLLEEAQLDRVRTRRLIGQTTIIGHGGPSTKPALSIELYSFYKFVIRALQTVDCQQRGLNVLSSCDHHPSALAVCNQLASYRLLTKGAGHLFFRKALVQDLSSCFSQFPMVSEQDFKRSRYNANCITAQKPGLSRIYTLLV